MGAECEFYASTSVDDATLSELAETLATSIPLFEKIERERGAGQLEFALHYTDDLHVLTENFTEMKQLIQSALPNVTFSPKPFADQPASGLHLHVHLENASSENVFLKTDRVMSDSLRYAIAGLLEKMPEAFTALCTTEADRARILSGAPDVPSTISWGANNRSCAIRLPDKAPPYKHIEYRLAGAEADIALSIRIVLSHILHGLDTKPPLQPQTYGHAFDAQYGLKRLT